MIHTILLVALASFVSVTASWSQTCDYRSLQGEWRLDKECVQAVESFTILTSRGVISADAVALHYFWNFSHLNHPDAIFLNRRDTCYTDKSRSSSKLVSNCWKWFPSDCKLKDASPGVLVDLLRQKKTCFVGDSLLMQLVNTVRARCLQQSNWVDCRALVLDRFATILFNPYTLRPMLPKEYQYCTSHNETSEGYFGSTGQNVSSTGIVCLPSYKAEPSNTRLYHRRLEYQGWTDWLETQKCETLIINTGHHNWKEEGVLHNPDLYSLATSNILKYLSENFRGDIVYLTSEPGHQNCDRHTAPLPQRQELKNDKWHWGLAANMNIIWRDTARSMGLPRFHVLNLSSLITLRADSHPPSDCLHFCEPGINDVVTDLLQSLLADVYWGVRKGKRARVKHAEER